MSASTPSTAADGTSVASPDQPNRRQVHVAAGALVDGDGRILVARRPDKAHQGGLWEFPGGKLEPGEAVRSALARELHEELGVRVRDARPLIRVHHDYGDRHVLLDVFLVPGYDGVPDGREGQPLRWLVPEAMDPAEFPAADRPIITALGLPDRYLITGQESDDELAFLRRLEASLQAGARLVQLRAHESNDTAYRRLAGLALPICRAAGARLLLNRDPERVQGVEADGLHLRADALRRLGARPEAQGLVGASCHDAGELELAARLGLDYALLGPVLKTATHPDTEPLGWEAFARLADAAELPVYALGGLSPDHLPLSFEHGAQGIAAIRGLWLPSVK